MKKINLFLLIIIVALIVSFITFFVIEQSKILQVTKYKMDVSVRDNDIIGINVDSDGFHFGGLSAGSGARRELKIHDVKADALFQIYAKGKMAKWISYPNNFIVKKGEDRNITFSIGIPADAPAGNYTGEIIVMLRKP